MALTLAELIVFARENGVCAIKANTSDADYIEANLELEWPPRVPATAAEPPQAPDTDICHCGHSHEIEHNGDGLCLKGCAVETCAGVGALAEASK